MLGFEIVVDLEFDCRMFEDVCVLFEILLGKEDRFFLNLIDVDWGSDDNSVERRIMNNLYC